MLDPDEKNRAEEFIRSGQRPTLKTISGISGLAVATVSRALHDASDIGDGTKKRVHEIAELVGYRPNRAGVRLRTGRTNVISLVLSSEHEMMNHTAKLISSVVGAMRDTQFHMIITPYFPDEDPMVPIRYIVETGSADGVIFNQTTPDDPRVAYLMQHRIPFATHGRTNWGAKHAYYDFDNREFGRLTVTALSERNRKNVVLVAPPIDQNYAIEMISGAQEVADARGVQLFVLKDVTSNNSGDIIQAAIAGFLREKPETDAIICSSPTSALAAINQVSAAGLSLGQDIDVFAKEAIPFLSRLHSELLIVKEDVATAGAFLARAVMHQITHPKDPLMHAMDVPEFPSGPDTR